MKALRYIIGALAIIFGIIFFAIPSFAVSFCGWMLAVVFLIIGIAAIVSYFRGKKEKQSIISTGIGMLIFGIIMVIFSILALFVDSVQTAFEVIVVIMFVVGLISLGINTIIASNVLFGTARILSLITGILMLVVGFYGIFSIFYAAVAFSVYAGVSFIMFGLAMFFGTRPIEHGEK